MANIDNQFDYLINPLVTSGTLLVGDGTAMAAGAQQTSEPDNTLLLANYLLINTETSQYQIAAGDSIFISPCGIAAAGTFSIDIEFWQINRRQAVELWYPFVTATVTCRVGTQALPTNADGTGLNWADILTVTPSGIGGTASDFPFEFITWGPVNARGVLIVRNFRGFHAMRLRHYSFAAGATRANSMVSVVNPPAG